MAEKKIERDDDQIMDFLDAAAKRHGIKRLAPEIKAADATHVKAESTLRAELNQYKLVLSLPKETRMIDGVVREKERFPLTRLCPLIFFIHLA